MAIGNTLTDLAVSVIDQKHPNDMAGDKETGKLVSSGLGAVGGAALGGGNVGATAAGVVAGDLVNSWASDASKQLANKISPDQKNTNDPKNKTDANGQGGRDIGQGNKSQPNSENTSKGTVSSESVKNQTYDTTTDINKVVSGITHDVIAGGLGAIAGILTGGGNVGLDAAAGGITSLKVAPKAEKPKDQKKDTKPTDTKKTTTGEPNAPK